MLACLGSMPLFWPSRKEAILQMLAKVYCLRQSILVNSTHGSHTQMPREKLAPEKWMWQILPLDRPDVQIQLQGLELGFLSPHVRAWFSCHR